MKINTVSGLNNTISVNNTGYSNNIQKTNNNLKSDTVCFTSKKKPSEAQPKKSGFVHKALIATTSALIPGLGQAINGQWGKALFCFAGVDILATGLLLAGNPLLATAIYAGGRAFTYIDAYRNA